MAAWQGRLREAAYTTPTGTRILFAYEQVSRETEKRTAAFEFPDVDDAYVQDNGHGARKYPMRCIFWGDEHDRAASFFEAGLLERGIGRLEHPFYGAFDVIPFGGITRREDLVSEANQSIIEVTFWTTVRAVYPSDQRNPRNEVLSALDAFDLASAEQFAATADLRKAVAKANLMATVRELLRATSAALSGASSAVLKVNREFRDLQQTVNYGLDVLVGQPLQLALQVSNLIKAPARAVVGIASRLDAYGQLAQRIIASYASTGDTYGTAFQSLRLRARNDFAMADLSALNAVGGSTLSVVENAFTTKSEAIAAVETLFTQLDEVVAWRDQRYADLDVVDTGASYQAIQQAVALAAGYVLQSSFSLAAERRVVLDRPRTIIDLAAELYGSVDDKLDFLISSNNLTSDQILELQRGQVISYYV